jgi:hypothetical protein
MLPLPSPPILAPHFCQLPFFFLLQPRHHATGGRIDYFLGTLYKTGVVVGRANNTTHSKKARRTHNTRKKTKRNLRQ